MSAARPIVKIATDAWEFDEIHHLNHQTFAEEIPQHDSGPSRRLVDRFHEENTDVVAVHDRRIAGMLAIRSARPFSLDRKLADLDAYLPPGRDVCELRLLAVDPAHRASAMLPALLAEAWRHIVGHGHDLAIISAYLGQMKLYAHLGFEPFGPLVGSRPDVMFQPMMLTLERFAPRAALSTLSILLLEACGRVSRTAGSGRYAAAPASVTMPPIAPVAASGAVG